MSFAIIRSRFTKPVTSVLCAWLICIFANGVSAHAAELRGGFPGAASTHIDVKDFGYDITKLKSELYHLNRSPELIRELDRIIGSLDDAAPKLFRVELDLYKLDSLAKAGDPSLSLIHI